LEKTEVDRTRLLQGNLNRTLLNKYIWACGSAFKRMYSLGINGKVNRMKAILPQLAVTSVCLAWKGYISGYEVCLDARVYFFTTRVIDAWNSLPVVH